jgi:hypothetical protein
VRTIHIQAYTTPTTQNARSPALVQPMRVESGAGEDCPTEVLKTNNIHDNTTPI